MVCEVTVKGYFEENCYFHIDEKSGHGFVIDPGAEAEKLIRIIEDNGWTIEAILLTHGHFDHIGAVNKLRERYHVPVFAGFHSDEYLMDVDNNLSSACGLSIAVEGAQKVCEGDTIYLQEDPRFSLTVIETPGHTTDSLIYYSSHEKLAFVGDTIFKGALGNYRYPGGDLHSLRDSIINKIFNLPDETVLYSGHSEPTKVINEKRRYGF